jgi:hypothetical protein
MSIWWNVKLIKCLSTRVMKFSRCLKLSSLQALWWIDPLMKCPVDEMSRHQKSWKLFLLYLLISCQFILFWINMIENDQWLVLIGRGEISGSNWGEGGRTQYLEVGNVKQLKGKQTCNCFGAQLKLHKCFNLAVKSVRKAWARKAARSLEIPWKTKKLRKT